MNPSLLPPQTLVAEDVYLLILNEANGKSLVNDSEQTRIIASAMIVDLVLSGAMEAVDNPVNPSTFLLRARAISPGLDPILIKPRNAADGHAPEPAILRLRRTKHQKPLAKRLAARGYVTRQPLSSRMPELNGEHESQVRAGLLQVLRDQREPDYREATLIALLLTVRKLATLFPAEDSAAIYTRAEEIAKDHWIQKAPKTRGVLDSAGAQIVEGIGDILSAWP